MHFLIARIRILQSIDQIHSLILTAADAPGLASFGLKVANNDELARFEKKVEMFGLTTRRISKGERLGEGEYI